MLRHMYSDLHVTKSTFTLLLSYMSGLPPRVKEGKVQEAEGIVKVYKDWEKTEKKEKEIEEEEEKEGEEVRYDGGNFEELTGKQKRKVYKRARLVYQTMGGGEKGRDDK